MSSPALRSALVVVLVAYAWWAVGLEPFSGGATAATLGAGLVAVVAGIGTAPPPRRGRLARPTLAELTPWLVVLAVLTVAQLVAFAQDPRTDHPTLSHLANSALDPRPIRALALMGWLVVCRRLAHR